MVEDRHKVITLAWRQTQWNRLEIDKSSSNFKKKKDRTRTNVTEAPFIIRYVDVVNGREQKEHNIHFQAK